MIVALVISLRMLRKQQAEKATKAAD